MLEKIWTIVHLSESGDAEVEAFANASDAENFFDELQQKGSKRAWKMEVPIHYREELPEAVSTWGFIDRALDREFVEGLLEIADFSEEVADAEERRSKRVEKVRRFVRDEFVEYYKNAMED